MKYLNKKYLKEYLDIDYINKLSLEEREWLYSFLQSYYGASPSPTIKIDEKESWRLSNERRRDIYNVFHKIDPETDSLNFIDNVPGNDSVLINNLYLEKEKKERSEMKKIKIVLSAPPFSINNAYYLKSFKGSKATKVRTQECRDWGDSILLQIKKYEDKLEIFRKNFNANKHCLHLKIVHTIPEYNFFTKTGEISLRSNDLSNVEKMPIDLLFDPRFVGRTINNIEINNLNLNDKYITKLVSEKKVGKAYKIEITVSIKEISR